MLLWLELATVVMTLQKIFITMGLRSQWFKEAEPMCSQLVKEFPSCIQGLTMSMRMENSLLYHPPFFRVNRLTRP
jgi:hypothetical protein